MNRSGSTKTINGDGADHQRYRGFIVFCETKLRYENGVKAWIFLGPYLLGALGLEVMIGLGQAKTLSGLGAVMGFLAYLILFPVVWGKILKVFSPWKKVAATTAGAPAVELP